MAEEKMTKNEAVINVLLNGGAMNTVEVAEKASEYPDLTMTDTEAAGLLSRIQKTDLGYFIERRKEGRRFVYEMIEEARVLTPEQARDLSLKRGKDLYTLEQAVEDYPDLGPIVQARQEEEALKAEEVEEEPVEEAVEEAVEPEEPLETEESPAEEPQSTADAGVSQEMPATEGKGDLLTELVGLVRSGIKIDVTHDVQVRIKFE